MNTLEQAEVERRRRVASMLADTLAPLVDAHLSLVPAQKARGKIVVSTDPALAKATEAVVLATERWNQARYTGQEPTARRALDRACETLTRQYRKLERRQ